MKKKVLSLLIVVTMGVFIGCGKDGQWVRNKESYIYIEHTDSRYFLSSYGTNW